jgi:hypothetical protein
MTTDLALRPRSPTELVDVAFHVYRRDPIQFIVATAAVYVPVLVLRLIFDLGISADLPTPGQAFFTGVASLAVFAVVGGVITTIASDIYLGAPPDAIRALRLALARIVPLLVSGIATLGMILIAAVFFVVPALYPLARFFAVRQAVVLEGAGAASALGRSSRLSEGVKRHILNTLLLVLLVTFAISFGSGLLLNLIPSRVLLNVLATALHVVLYPFLGITETVLYYDIRGQRDGRAALTLALWQATARDTTDRWSASAIHDTVAAIARQPAYSTSVRESLLGRFFRFLFEQLGDLLRLLHGSPGARYVVIVAVALIVLVIVSRLVVWQQIDARVRARATQTADGRTRQDFWTEARRLASGGDHDAACHALYAAVLDQLARAGAVRVHPSKTSGDYARELARRGVPVAPAFQAFARQFERIVFGVSADAISADDFERLATAAERVSATRQAA